MTVYVDPLMNHGWQMYDKEVANCHLFTDSIELRELHALAQRIGLRREWFQNSAIAPHYDLTPGRRHAAIAAGAVELGRRAAVAVWKARRAVLAAVVRKTL